MSAHPSAPPLPDPLQRLGPLLPRLGRIERRLVASVSETGPDAPASLEHVLTALLDRHGGRPEEAAARVRAWSAARPGDPDVAFLLGECLRESGDWRAAQAAYADALSLDGDHAEARASHGLTLIVRGQRREGIEACARACALRPDLAAAWRYRAHGLLREGRLDEAAAGCEEALRLAPDAPEGQVMQALIWHRCGLGRGARRALDRVIAAHPDLAEARANRALLRLIDGDPEGALADVEHALARKPRLTPAVALRARLHEARGEHAQALGRLEELRRLDPANPDWTLQQLDLLESLRRFDEAAALCEAFAAEQGATHRSFRLRLAMARLRRGETTAALSLIPGAGPGVDAATAWRLLGAALRTAGEPSLAWRCLDRALSLSPGDAWQAELAEAMLETGHAEKALTALDALESPPREAALTRARALAQLGRADEALPVLEAAVAEHPDFGLAHLRLGILARQQGKSALAEGALREAIRRSPGEAAPHEQLGILLSERGDGIEAEAAFREALKRAPDSASAQLNLAILLGRLKRYAEAEGLLRGLARRNPADPAVWRNLAGVLMEQRRHADALEAAERLTGMLPDDEATNHLLLAVLDALKRAEDAMRAATAWVEASPDCASAWAALALACTRAERHEEAEQAACRLAECEPDTARRHEVDGLVHSGAGRYREAVDSFRRGLEHSPDALSLRTNLGFALQELGEKQEAVDNLTRSAELAPDNGQIHMNLGMVLLRQGRYDGGWPAYDRREGALRGPGSLPDARTRAGAPPDLSDASVLVRAEQGMGDTLHFMRYVRRLAGECREVLFQLQDPITWTAWWLGDNVRVFGYRDEVPPADYQVSLLSLPGYYATGIDSIPADVPYIHADAGRVRRWGERIGGGGFRIGIVWHTDPNHGNIRRWIPLERLAALAGLPGVRLISLQKHHGLEQLDAFPAGCPVETLGEDFDSGGDAFVDTAAVMMSLDLVITIDTAVAHLAGALGRPAWVLLSRPSDWRWLSGRADTPWYPSLRLFRQARPNDWDPVVADVRARLEAVLRGDVPAIWPVGEGDVPPVPRGTSA